MLGSLRWWLRMSDWTWVGQVHRWAVDIHLEFVPLDRFLVLRNHSGQFEREWMYKFPDESVLLLVPSCWEVSVAETYYY